MARKKTWVNSDSFSRSRWVMRMCAFSAKTNPSGVAFIQFSSVDAEGNWRKV